MPLNAARFWTGGRPPLGDGSTERDYTFVTDIVQGITGAIDHAEPFAVYNLGESRTISLLELIGMIERSLGKRARIRVLPPQPGDVVATWADISRAARRIGYEPRHPIEAGIPLFVDWYLKSRRNR